MINGPLSALLSKRVPRTLCCAGWCAFTLVWILSPNAACQQRAQRAVGNQQNRPRSVAQPDHLKDIVSRLSEYYVLLVTGRRSLEQSAPPLDYIRRKEIQSWLSTLLLKDEPEPARTDLERCRHAMIDFLSGATSTFQALPLIIAAIVDAEVDQASLVSLRNRDLAEALRTILVGARRALLVHWGADFERGNTTSVNERLFVDYFVVANALLDHSRPIVAQAALLSLDPKAGTDVRVRQEFTEIHQELLQYSRKLSANNGDQQAGVMSVTTLRIARLRDKLRLKDAEIRSYGGAKLFELATSMRELFK
jgi:hypothetical protein